MTHKTTIILTMLVCATWLLPTAAAAESDPAASGGSKPGEACRTEQTFPAEFYACAHGLIAYQILGECTRHEETKTRDCDVLFTLDLTVEGYASCGEATSEYISEAAFACTVLPTPITQGSARRTGTYTFEGVPDSGDTFEVKGEVCIDYRNYGVLCNPLNIDVVIAPTANMAFDPFGALDGLSAFALDAYEAFTTTDHTPATIG